MLRTSLRSLPSSDFRRGFRFLSSNAQDFIEELLHALDSRSITQFLSSNAQDFIEESNGYDIVAQDVPNS